MKRVLQCFMFMVALIMVTSFGTNIALAEEVEDDNLKVELDVQSVSDSEKEIKGTVKVTNIGTRPINSITVKGILPKEITLKEGTLLTEEIGTLEPGEKRTFEFNGEIKKDIPPTIDEEEKPTIEKPTIDEPTINKPTATKPGNGVKTGDNNLIPILVVVIVLCAGGIFFISKKGVKNKGTKKFLSIFLSLTMASALFQGAITAEAAEPERRDVSVKEDITLNDKKYTIEAVVSYETPAVMEPSGEGITRGQWISMLVDIMNWKDIQPQKREDTEYIFNDIEDHQYAEDILYALINSAIDTKEEAFRPDDPATREFVTVTAVKALAFEPYDTVQCEDAGEILEPSYVQTALAVGLVTLENNCFYPGRSITEGEAQYVVEGIKGILKSTEIDADYESEIEYVEGVILFEDESIYTVDGTTVTFALNDTTKSLKADSVFILADYTTYKAVTVQVQGDKVIVETVEPEIQQVISELDIEQKAIFDINDFIPEEGVEIVSNTSESSDDTTTYEKDGRKNPLSLNLEFEIPLSKDGNVKFKGEGKFTVNDIDIKTDADILKGEFRNCYAKVNSEFEISAMVGSEMSDEDWEDLGENLFVLGKLPVGGIPFVTAYVEVALTYSIEGGFKSVYTLQGDLGAQIYRNHFRGINTITSDFDLKKLEGSCRFGPKVSTGVEFFGRWKLIDFSAEAGGSVDAYLAIRDDGKLICVNGDLYIYAEMEAFEKSIIKELLKRTYKAEIWNEENSPLRGNMHFENLVKVPQCTYKAGTIKGTVAEAVDRTKPISDVNIEIYEAEYIHNKKVIELKSDVNGQYSTKLKAGKYRIVVSKEGYIPFECIETIEDDDVKYVETYLMINEGNEGETGFAGGTIVNAVTGVPVSDVSLKIRKGWNKTSGSVIATSTTDDLGNYKNELPLGNYTVEMSKSDYITASFNIIVLPGTTLNQNGAIVPESSEILPGGDLRVVLTWGDIPYDLDSHLLGPTADGNDYFHIHYGNKTYGEDEVTMADLDIDDTNSYGPETTTIYKANNTGKYSFYVYDYSNGGYDESTYMSNSGAQVKVYKGDVLYAIYNVPTNRQGDTWKVFEYDATTNSIKPINEFVDEITYTNNEEISSETVIPMDKLNEKFVK